MQIVKDLSGDPAAGGRTDPANIAFGKTFSPHSFVAEYKDGAWQSARIAPIEPFSLHPGALVLHYAQSIFEGLKAFAQADGGVALFRPERNARRFQASAARMAMPHVDEALFLEAILGLVAADHAFIPRFPGSLYIRPAMIATQPYIGVSSSTEFKFFIVTLPAGAYFPGLASGAGAVDVLISESVVRAFPGGTGNIKTAANYAITLQVTSKAAAAGCGQVLFLDSSPARRVEELGGMNVLFVEDGSLVTPPLNDTILPGVIRDSVLHLAKDQGLPVREYAYTLNELQGGLRSGKITEAIACGTAAVVTGIRRFHLESGGTIPVGNASGPGPVTSALFEHLQGIQYGRLPDKHGWLLHVDGVRLD
jgi:branched-chain amino acid aminotransferase